jgi:hypothetical protein
VAVTGATNATPIVLTVVAHPFVTGDAISGKNIGGNTAANVTAYAQVVDANHIAMFSDTAFQNGVAGNGAFTSGGTAQAPRTLSAAPNDKSNGQMVARIIAAPVPGQAGTLFFGIAGLGAVAMNQMTFANVLRAINAPGATGILDMVIVEESADVLHITDYAVDSAVTTEGMIISYWVR